VNENLNRYFIELAYKGTKYHGWQIQPNAITVQEELNRALSILSKQNVETLGCGRTDTGVHASQFYAHFDSHKSFDEIKPWVRNLNSILKEDIFIFDIHAVAPDAHTRFDATSRSYSYYIAKHKSIFLRDLMWFTPIKLDVAYLNTLTDVLKSNIQFESFSKTGVQHSTFECQITESVWTEHEHCYQFSISANRFLRGMVRAIVGTMYEFNKQQLPSSELKKILDSADRSKAGHAAPPQGLFLEQIIYPYLIKAKQSPFQL
jgi:tRNA pseudouridine38-40 synthase